MLTRDKLNGIKLSVEQVLHNAWLQNDQDVVLIKIIDRMHNISTVSYLPLHKQRQQIVETIRNFLIFAEAMSLPKVSDFLYQECLNLNIKLGIVFRQDITKQESVFCEKPILPFPTSQNN